MRNSILGIFVGLQILTLAPRVGAITITQTGLASSYSVGDTITLQYWLDNMGFPGLAVVGTTLVFDPAFVSPDVSGFWSAPAILRGSDDEGGNTPNDHPGLLQLGGGPFLISGTTDSIHFAWSSGASSSWSEVSNQLIATLVFDANSAGVAGFFLGGQGTSVAQDNGTYANAGVSFSDITGSLAYLGEGSTTIVPEPTSALLLAAGLLGLGRWSRH